LRVKEIPSIEAELAVMSLCCTVLFMVLKRGREEEKKKRRRREEREEKEERDGGLKGECQNQMFATRAKSVRVSWDIKCKTGGQWSPAVRLITS
jgi:hypothetical protein